MAGPEFAPRRTLEAQLARFPQMTVRRTPMGGIQINYPSSSSVDRLLEINPYNETAGQVAPFVSVVVKDFDKTKHTWEPPVQFVLKPVRSDRYEVTTADERPHDISFGIIVEKAKLGLSIMKTFLQLPPGYRDAAFAQRITDDLAEGPLSTEMAAWRDEIPGLFPDVDPADYAFYLYDFFRREPTPDEV